MRTCIVFRGENLRFKHGYTSALGCVENWKEAIFDVIDCDVAFFTYPSDILEELVKKIKPIHVSTGGYDSQESNALVAIDWMLENRSNYDRFVLVRFDKMYRKRITQWPHWEKNGIFFTNRDVNYPLLKLYNDMTFIIDAPWVEHFKRAFVAVGKPLRICLHHIGKYIEEDMPEVPLHLMYTGYYNLTHGPFHACHPLEAKPNLDEEYAHISYQPVGSWDESEFTKSLKPHTTPPSLPPYPSRPIHRRNVKRSVIPKQQKIIPRQDKMTMPHRSRPFVLFNRK